MEQYQVLFEENELIYVKYNNINLKMNHREYDKWKINKLEI